MAAYLPQTLPPPPDSVDWLSKIPASAWGPMGNLTYGCCALSGIGHVRQQQTAYATGTAQIATDPQVLSWYSQVTGFDAARPETDRGTVMEDALAAWLNPGFPVGPGTVERISAFCAIQPANRIEVQRSILWFGSIYFGIELPLAWQRSGPWDVGPAGMSGDWAPGSWGGHALVAFSYDTNYLYCISWGRIQKLSWAAFHAYTDECFCVLSEDWKRPPGFTPAGIPWTTLVADMDVIRNGG